jgi:hypothetical protein
MYRLDLLTRGRHGGTGDTVGLGISSVQPLVSFPFSFLHPRFPALQLSPLPYILASHSMGYTAMTDQDT